MKAKLIVDNREFEVEVSEEQLKHLSKKQTGYERAQYNKRFYYDFCGKVMEGIEMGYSSDNRVYDDANYYSDKDMAVNNIRADRLMRQLRRYSVEHRKDNIDWSGAQKKYFIFYHHDDKKLYVDWNYIEQDAFIIYFDSEQTAWDAIDEYCDELIWYFTEYKDCL